jgi:hypothetical protein
VPTQHGVLAPNASPRERVTALGRFVPDTSPQPGLAPDPPTPTRSAVRARWVRLLARIDEVFPLRCPDCGAERRILAFLTDPFIVAGILRHLGLPTSAPLLTPARSPPPDEPAYEADPILDLDQTPAFDPTEPDPIPDFDFDQTHGA